MTSTFNPEQNAKSKDLDARLSAVASICNSIIREAEAGGLWV